MKQRTICMVFHVTENNTKEKQGMPKRFSSELLRSTVIEKRKKLGMKQAELSEATGIHRGLLSRLENGSFTPSVDQ
ncbi:MAG: helix-turn-helix transcriptional regulator, partial [Clostridia bacterium]|nr:helix-turn-helix transcriptional regulator [Clostridia bacterium]